MKIKHVCLMLLLVIVFLTGCSKELSNPSVLEISNCELPCWLGIQVGSTTQIELENIVSSHPEIEHDSIVYLSNWYGYEEGIKFTTAEVTKDTNPIEITTLLEDDIVTFIKLYGDLEINIQQIIDIVGPPDIVRVAYEHQGDLIVHLVFSEKGLHVMGQVNNEKEAITGDLELKLLDIFEATDYQILLESGFLLNSPYNPNEKTYYLWDGYGVIEEKYWPLNRN